MKRATGYGRRAGGLSALAALALAGCAKAPPAGSVAQPSADEFVAQVNAELKPILREVAAADWTQATDITLDTQLLSARANDRYLEYLGAATDKAKAYTDAPGTPATKRSLMLLKLQTSAPAPSDPAKRAELTEILASLGAMYGEGKYCPSGPDSCRNLDQLSETLATSRDYKALEEAWVGWHDTARPMRPKYQRFVELANEGAREFGFADLGAMWRSGYDMPPDEFAAEAARLWGQVKPLYNEMQCYARGRLAQRYGEDKVPAGKPIPAHLLGNMWAQTWNKVYDDILKPYPKASIESADRGLAQQKWDAVRMTKSAEAFYTSIGFPALPQTFWERSMLVRPRDREVVCHASAWDMDDANDVRIKMCMRPNEEDLFTIYHELGHVYYYLWYNDLPLLFQNGAHDGFHEAIGDTVNLSVTPQYLHRIGLVGAVKPSPEAVINQQMKMASEKIAFLPFGKVIDEWRWKVFAGEIKPEHYNEAWWQLRTQYQGVAPPVARTEADFDPGSKYHVPGNTPYTRYFLSFIIQFQFQKALCDAAGFKGPLHECSIFGNKAAGEKFAAMLKLGQSEPWQDTLEKLTGTRQMDASAILEYFQPLQSWLAEQNKGQACGW
ncbi:MAG: M2 family metallopeptidase [Steroidobacteraceae bacterium]